MSGGASLDWLAGDLAVGGCPSEDCVERLPTRHGIGAMVDLRVEAQHDHAVLTRAGILFLNLPTEDLAAVRETALDDGIAFVRRARLAGRRVLIHCQHGIGRSAILALAVLVDRGMAPLDALRLAKERRALISPSPAQYGAWAAWLQSRHPHAAIPDFAAFAAIAYRHLRPAA